MLSLASGYKSISFICVENGGDFSWEIASPPAWRSFNSTGDAVAVALELLREQSEWLIQNRGAVDAQIQQGLAGLDRGEGIPEADLDAYLTRLKALPE